MFDESMQSIEVGPIKVDTGNDWMDVGFGAGLLVLFGIVMLCIRRKGRNR